MGEAVNAHESLFTRLVLWTVLGLFFAVAECVCGLRGDWIGFLPSLVVTNVSIFFLYTGLWMRWPRG